MKYLMLASMLYLRYSKDYPSMLWQCWLGIVKGIWPVKIPFQHFLQIFLATDGRSHGNRCKPGKLAIKHCVCIIYSASPDLSTSSFLCLLIFSHQPWMVWSVKRQWYVKKLTGSWTVALITDWIRLAAKCRPLATGHSWQHRLLHAPIHAFTNR